MNESLRNTKAVLAKQVVFSKASGNKIIASVQRGESITRYTINESILSFLDHFKEAKTIASVIDDLSPKGNEQVARQLYEFASGILKTPLLEFETNEREIHTAQNAVEAEGFTLINAYKDRKYDGVYLVEDGSKQRHVMKIVKTTRASENATAIKEKIQNEYDILSLFKADKNIVNASLYSEKKHTMMLLDYIEGNSLTSCISKQTDPLIRLSYCQQIIKSIRALHELSFFHGDIHTSNFLVTDQDEVIMIDLDCACNKDYKYIPKVGGALHFTPPENLIDSWYSTRADLPTIPAEVYQLGTVLYYVLTGTPPFRGETYQQLKDNIMHNTDIATVDCFDSQQLNIRVSDMVIQCLNKSPDQRPVSVDAVYKSWRDLPTS